MVERVAVALKNQVREVKKKMTKRKRKKEKEESKRLPSSNKRAIMSLWYRILPALSSPMLDQHYPGATACPSLVSSSSVQ